MRQKVEQYKFIKPTEREIDFVQSWSTKREQPKWKFILLHGVLKEGLVIFSIIKIIQFFIEREGFVEFYASARGIFFLLFEISFWIFGGIVIGWFRYNSNEIEYELIKGLME